MKLISTLTHRKNNTFEMPLIGTTTFDANGEIEVQDNDIAEKLIAMEIGLISGEPVAETEAETETEGEGATKAELIKMVSGMEGAELMTYALEAGISKQKLKNKDKEQIIQLVIDTIK